MNEHNPEHPAHSPWESAIWLGPVALMAYICLYFVARYGGLWSESDSAVFSNMIRTVVDSGQLSPTEGPVYANGYSYQAITAFISALTGLDVPTLQKLVFPLTAILVVVPAWILYRELTGNGAAATVVTLLLFTQPEFLFVILRSSHEKFTRVLTMLCLFLLVRSMRLYKQPVQLAIHVVLFYLAAYAMIASNNLLANSFIFAVAIALVLGQILHRRWDALDQPSSTLIPRLTYVLVTCIGIAFVFTFYAYPPARYDLLVLRNVWEQIAALLLDYQTHSTNVYSQIEAGWINLPTYFLLSSANWIILVSSLIIWLYQGVRWMRYGVRPETPAGSLLWLLYAAFSFQGGLAILADMSGALASNLQHRIFPSFAIIAVAIVGGALMRWRPQRYVQQIRILITTLIAVAAILAVLKSTIEPMLSNKWIFHRHSELVALDWTDQHVYSHQIWTEFDERLSVAWLMNQGVSTNQNRFVGGTVNTEIHGFILSDLTRLRSVRLKQALPIPTDALLVYDNGEAQLYHRRPLTPYQK